jgi:hypothetical protein
MSDAATDCAFCDKGIVVNPDDLSESRDYSEPPPAEERKQP